MGLLAFRNGNMYEVQGALSELCSYGRTKELLGQGFNKPQEKESLRNKVLPYHLHINVDMVESVELIAAMVLEIPYTLEDGGRITSKTLKKVYEHYERSVRYYNNVAFHCGATQQQGLDLFCQQGAPKSQLERML